MRLIKYLETKVTCQMDSETNEEAQLIMQILTSILHPVALFLEETYLNQISVLQGPPLPGKLPLTWTRLKALGASLWILDPIYDWSLYTH